MWGRVMQVGGGITWYMTMYICPSGFKGKYEKGGRRFILWKAVCSESCTYGLGKDF